MLNEPASDVDRVVSIGTEEEVRLSTEDKKSSLLVVWGVVNVSINIDVIPELSTDSDIVGGGWEASNWDVTVVICSLDSVVWPVIAVGFTVGISLFSEIMMVVITISEALADETRAVVGAEMKVGCV